jgi:peptidoglycan-N-acetylglucosamine deacetylase
VPKLLELLRGERLPATFFIPGWVAERHTDRCKEIIDAGFEIGHHGYSHEWADPKHPEKECEDFDRGAEVLDHLLGCKPRGYRPPGAEITANTIKMLADRGYLYNSNMLDDVYPYRHILPDGRKGPIELPTHWSIGDANYVWNAIRHPRVIQTSDHIFTVWKDEFDALYEWGGLFNLVLHPQAIGRPSRISLLRRFIAYVRTFENVWWATGTEVAEAFAASESA